MYYRNKEFGAQGIYYNDKSLIGGAILPCQELFQKILDLGLYHFNEILDGDNCFEVAGTNLTKSNSFYDEEETIFVPFCIEFYDLKDDLIYAIVMIDNICELIKYDYVLGFCGCGKVTLYDAPAYLRAVHSQKLEQKIQNSLQKLLENLKNKI